MRNAVEEVRGAPADSIDGIAVGDTVLAVTRDQDNGLHPGNYYRVIRVQDDRQRPIGLLLGDSCWWVNSSCIRVVERIRSVNSCVA